MKVYKFFSPVCGPCKVLQHNIEKAEIKVTPIDVFEEENISLAEKYGVRNVPCLVLVDDEGNLVRKHTGVLTIEELMFYWNVSHAEDK